MLLADKRTSKIINLKKNSVAPTWVLFFGCMQPKSVKKKKWASPP
jgi:hypothetical protein